MAMTAVERQRRRREKIKNALEEVKYEPKQFIAHAVRKLYRDRFISDQALEIIKNTAIELIPKYVENPNNITIKYITQNIENYLRGGE